jgi:hypothetical protein
MSTWNEAASAAPELARLVQDRFEATGLGYLATIRVDGSPRISGVEPFWWDDAVWLGMMWESRKALDLRRDTRFSLQSANVDKDVKDGDARISGRAEEVFDDGVKAGMGAAFAERSEHDFNPNDVAPFHLFRLDISELYFLVPQEGHLLLRWWTPEGGLHRHERG